MAKYKKTPKTTIERLPIYYRTLEKLKKQDVKVISSKKLGEKIGIPSTQVRKDLSYYGEFGRRGVGYEISVLLKNLKKILGLNQNWEIVAIGAGNLGRALIDYKGFEKLNLNINYIFDVDQEKIGKSFGDIEINSIDKMIEIVKEKEIKIAILAIPGEAAQEIANDLVEVGVKAIWNFAPIHLKLPREVKVRNEDLSTGLISLTYHLSK